jgi:hypothetical protein
MRKTWFSPPPAIRFRYSYTFTKAGPGSIVTTRFLPADPRVREESRFQAPSASGVKRTERMPAPQGKVKARNLPGRRVPPISQGREAARNRARTSRVVF